VVAPVASFTHLALQLRSRRVLHRTQRTSPPGHRGVVRCA
jgi:hypothetical protein